MAAGNVEVVMEAVTAEEVRAVALTAVAMGAVKEVVAMKVEMGEVVTVVARVAVVMEAEMGRTRGWWLRRRRRRRWCRRW